MTHFSDVFPDFCREEIEGKLSSISSRYPAHRIMQTEICLIRFCLLVKDKLVSASVVEHCVCVCVCVHAYMCVCVRTYVNLCTCGIYPSRHLVLEDQCCDWFAWYLCAVTRRDGKFGLQLLSHHGRSNCRSKLVAEMHFACCRNVT